ncbi:MAG: hypothetical protein R3C14_19565 [Caldilineaceae bacterium]
MSNAQTKSLFQRKSLDQITEIPKELISVYVVEDHIWQDKGADEARRKRCAETRTVNEFLINPVRPFLNDIFRQISAPYDRQRKDNPIGQGYWIQAEFGSGKSHLVSFLGALALGGEAEWAIIREKERDAGVGRRESLYNFYENGLAKKTQESKGIFVAVKTLVGQGGSSVGIADKSLTDYALDAVADQFYRETGESLPLYPTEILAKRFLETEDLSRYQRDLARFLKDPNYFDEEEQEELSDFLDDLRNNLDPGVQRDCGQKLWDFYERYLETRPRIPLEPEELLKHMVERLLDYGYAGLLLILDEVSLYMSGRDQNQRVKDEQALVILSNRLAKVENLPIWTVCTAQQAIESKMAGSKNIIARERLDLVPLLSDPNAYYDIALARVRKVTDEAAVETYYEDYQRSFSWPKSIGRSEFARFFPFYPPGIQVVKSITSKLTTVRSALYFLLETLKHQRKLQSRELITLWALFEEVVTYEEDPSGTTRSVAAIKTSYGDAWKAYETARQQLDTITQGPLKVYRARCEKILKTLFLYHVADAAPNGLGSEDLMNSVMEWKDHAKDQAADLQDNLGHYELLVEKIALELAQVVEVDRKFRFNPTGGSVDPRVHFDRARAAATENRLEQTQAWEALLAFAEWDVTTALMTMDLTFGIRSLFREIALNNQVDLTVKWHNREIVGRVYMRDLLLESQRNNPLPSVNSDQTDLDFALFVSTTHTGEHIKKLVQHKNDQRVLFWTPDELLPAERELLIDFVAYRTLVSDFRARDDQQSKEVLNWVQSRLRNQMGSIYKIVPDAYGRGAITALNHGQLTFACRGDLENILTPLVGQVLDATYVSRDLVFEAPAPFNDTNALYVINGIVKVGEIARDAKPNRDISAAQNYGFGLQIMQRPNNRKLDIRECRYTTAMLDWLDDKLGDSTGTVAVESIYKNFMGTGGPGGLHFGLSRRLIQLYLLCLVREAKIRVTLTGRGQPVEYIDYTNIAEIDFRVAVVQGFDQIQKLQPPEGWDTLGPFAAILLDDESVRNAQQDAEIQQSVQRLLSLKKDRASSIGTLKATLAALFTEIGVKSPVHDELAAWESFWTSPVEPDLAIQYLRHGLDQAFGYRVFADDVVDPQEVDDLKARRNALAQMEKFAGYRERLQTIARYAKQSLPDDPALQPIRDGLLQAQQQLHQLCGALNGFIQNETKLLSELIEPAETAIKSYQVRYLQLYDDVTAHTEQVRQAVAGLATEPVAVTLRALDGVPSLGEAAWSAIAARIKQVADDPGEFIPTRRTRQQIEQDLKLLPQPSQCDLTLGNGAQWIARADGVLTDLQESLDNALLAKARLLHSPSLWARLEQSKGNPFIDGLLALCSDQAVADYLVDQLGTADGKDQTTAITGLLSRTLRTLRVRKVRLVEFTPSRRTLEAGDVAQVVAEFRDFLQAALQAEGDETPVLELE